MTTTLTGRQAEALVAAWLAQKGFRLLARNWRNRWCEIDLVVASPTGVVHLLEVKYRRNHQHGSGLEYITTDKARRLRRAALAWSATYNYNGPIQLDVVAVSGSLLAPAFEWIPNAVPGEG